MHLLRGKRSLWFLCIVFSKGRFLSATEMFAVRPRGRPARARPRWHRSRSRLTRGRPASALPAGQSRERPQRARMGRRGAVTVFRRVLPWTVPRRDAPRRKGTAPAGRSALASAEKMRRCPLRRGPERGLGGRAARAVPAGGGVSCVLSAALGRCGATRSLLPRAHAFS